MRPWSGVNLNPERGVNLNRTWCTFKPRTPRTALFNICHKHWKFKRMVNTLQFYTESLKYKFPFLFWSPPLNKFFKYLSDNLWLWLLTFWNGLEIGSTRGDRFFIHQLLSGHQERGDCWLKFEINWIVNFFQTRIDFLSNKDWFFQTRKSEMINLV